MRRAILSCSSRARSFSISPRKPWSKERLPLVVERIRQRLEQLAARLGHAEWLDGEFSAGDLVMVSVLLRLRPSGILNEFPSLAALFPAARPIRTQTLDAF